MLHESTPQMTVFTKREIEIIKNDQHTLTITNHSVEHKFIGQCIALLGIGIVLNVLDNASHTRALVLR